MSNCARSGHVHCGNLATVDLGAGAPTGWALCEECAETLGLCACAKCARHVAELRDSDDGYVCAECDEEDRAEYERWLAESGGACEHPWDSVDREYDAARDSAAMGYE